MIPCLNVCQRAMFICRVEGHLEKMEIGIEVFCTVLCVRYTQVQQCKTER